MQETPHAGRRGRECSPHWRRDAITAVIGPSYVELVLDRWPNRDHVWLGNTPAALVEDGILRARPAVSPCREVLGLTLLQVPLACAYEAIE